MDFLFDQSRNGMLDVGCLIRKELNVVLDCGKCLTRFVIDMSKLDLIPVITATNMCGQWKV